MSNNFNNILNGIDINEFSLDSVPTNLNVTGFKFLLRYTKSKERIFSKILDAYLREFDREDVNMLIWCGNDLDKSYIISLINLLRSKTRKANFGRVFFADNNIKAENLFPAVDIYIDLDLSNIIFKAMACGTWVFTMPNQFIGNETPYSIEQYDVLYLQAKLRTGYEYKGYDRKKIRKNFEDICQKYNVVFPDNRKDLSVCVLIHNNPKINACLDLIKRYGRCKEIIVVDNGSTVDNGLIKYPGIILKRLDKNYGVIKGRNLAASMATCKYILFLDDDQFVGEDSIKKLYGVVDGGVDCAGAVLNMFDRNATGYEIKEYSDDEMVYLGAGGFIISNELFKKMNGYDEIFGMAYCEDPDLFWKLREKGYTWKWISNADIIHHEHTTLLSQTTFDWEYEQIKNNDILRNRWAKKFAAPKLNGVKIEKPVEVIVENQVDKLDIIIREGTDNKDEEEIKLGVDKVTQEKDNENLKIYNTENDLVSIIILTYNNYEYNKKCIDGILDKTKYDNYEIIILDNNSNDGTVKWLQSLNNNKIKVIFNRKNSGYSKGCNKAVLNANGKYMVFLNNDTEIIDGDWINKFLSVYNNDFRVGIVGCKLLYDNNSIQHAGINIEIIKNNHFNVVHRYRCLNRDYALSNVIGEVDAVTGACLMIPKYLFDLVNGFNEDYLNGYEDIDMCLKIKEEGYKVWYCPGCEIRHHEAKSTNRFSNENSNKQKFNANWKDKLPIKSNYKNNLNYKKVKNKSGNILYLMDKVPYNNRNYKIIKFLSENFKVDLLFNVVNDKKHIDDLLESGIKCYGDIDKGFNDIGHKKYSVCIISSYSLTRRYFKIIKEYFGDVKIIIDSMGLKWVEAEKQVKNITEGLSKITVDLIKKNELKNYFKADILWVLSHEEKNIIKNISPHCDVRVVSCGEDSDKLVIANSIYNHNEVVISIISYNRKDLLKKCVDSILHKTNFDNYKIAVVCNGGNDSSKKMMEEYVKNYPGKIYFYYNETNEFFIKPNNFVIGKFKNSDILMLNNDVEIINENWLSELYRGVYSEGNIGCAGPKKIGIDGKLLEAGAYLYSDGIGINIGQYDINPNKIEYNVEKYVGYVGGCCMYMRRDAINKFGALDEDFYPMYYEDSAWQYNLHRYGWRALYVPSSEIIHLEGATSGKDIKSGMKKYQEINRPKFVEKFGKEIKEGKILI